MWALCTYFARCMPILFFLTKAMNCVEIAANPGLIREKRNTILVGDQKRSSSQFAATFQCDLVRILKPGVLIADKDDYHDDDGLLATISIRSQHEKLVRLTCDESGLDGLSNATASNWLNKNLTVVVHCQVSKACEFFRKASIRRLNRWYIRWAWLLTQEGNITDTEGRINELIQELDETWQLAVFRATKGTDPCDLETLKVFTLRHRYEPKRLGTSKQLVEVTDLEGMNSLSSVLQQSNLIQPTLHKALMRNAVVPALPWVDAKRSNKTGALRLTRGIDVRLLQTLAQCLNFSVELHEVQDQEWGRKLPNGSYYGIVGAIWSGNADIAVNDVSMLLSRIEGVDFSYPYYRGVLIFTLRKPEEIGKTFVLLRPFTVQVWIGLAIAFLATYLGLLMIAKATDRIRQKPSLALDTCGIETRLVLQTTKLFLTEGSIKLERPGSPLVSVGLFLAVVSISFIAAAFSGSLKAYMIRPGYEKVPKTFEELGQAMEYNISIRRGNLLLGLLQASNLPSDRSISQRITEKYNGAGLLADPYEGYRMAAASHRHAHISETASLIATAKAERLSHLLMQSEDGQFPHFSAVALRKGSPLTPLIDRKILHIWAAGLMKFWLNEMFLSLEMDAAMNESLSPPPDVESDQQRPLSLSDLQGIFYIWGVGLACAFLAFVREVAVSVASYIDLLIIQRGCSGKIN